MKLKSFGCSFIWGSEMHDTTVNTSQPSNTTWPALLAQHLNIPYKCYAHPGAGNFFIANQCLNQLASKQPALYVINWTWIDRFDYQDPNYNDGRWETLRPGTGNHNEQECNFYYRNLHSELRDKITSLQLIKLVTLELQASKQPFIMTYVDDLLFDVKWHITPAIIAQQDYLKPIMHTFDGVNMCQYSARLGHKITASNHPLEAAHQDLFKYALANFGVDKI